VRGSDLPALLGQLAPGAFGLSAVSVAALERLVESVDVGLAAAAGLEGLILAEAGTGGGFSLPELSAPQVRLVSAFCLAVFTDALARRAAELAPLPEVTGMLDLDGMDALLDTGKEPAALLGRVLRLAKRYVELHPPASGPGAPPADKALVSALTAFCELLRRAAVTYVQSGMLRPLITALEGRDLTVSGHRYRGLTIEAPRPTSDGLLPVWPENVVGNEAYLQAGLRLARDVAGFDLKTRKNPKRVNPVLFGLGRPGCGKTLTAHAIGNYFLRYCGERGVPAKFLVVRRTDWASSYQNASALNLVRIFKEEVYGIEGVCGVYWADIDTAIASRGATELRMEEKQNLGALFAIFDGTLLPKDGKWFLICDANTMHMDEAAVSRIAQNPFTVEGPTRGEHYVQMLRDIMLKDLRDLLPADPAAWERVGEVCREAQLSGRVVESIAGNLRSHIQEFEYPDAYFKASAEERAALIKQLSRPVDEPTIIKAIQDWKAFQAESTARAERQRFDAEVADIVRQLNVSRAAAERAVEQT
jgi:hypothetical protein